MQCILSFLHSHWDKLINIVSSLFRSKGTLSMNSSSVSQKEKITKGFFINLRIFKCYFNKVTYKKYKK